MTVYELKILPKYFKAQKDGYVVLGTKLAELRLGLKRLAAKIMA